MVGSTNSIWEINRPFEQLVNYTMLYDRGFENAETNECKEVTGGWSGYACTTSWHPSYNQSAPTVVKYDTYIQATHSPSNSLGALLTNNAIDFTGYKKYSLYGYFNSSGSSYAWQQAMILNKTSGVADRLADGDGVANAVKTGWLNTDLTEKTGSGYIGMGYYYYGITTTTKIYYAVLFKSDDWQPLIKLTGMSVGSIDGILESSTTLLSNKNAVEYMIKQCTGDFMISAVQSETFLTALNNSQYKTIIMANEHWAKFLNMVV